MAIVARERSASADGCDEVQSGAYRWSSESSTSVSGPDAETATRSRVLSRPTRSMMHQSANRGTTSRETVRRVVAASSEELRTALDSDSKVERRSADSARARAACSASNSLARSASVWIRSPMSRAIFEAPMTRPSASLIGDTVSATLIGVPSLRTRTVSKCSIVSPRRRRLKTSSSSPWRSAGTIILMDRPIASGAVKPKSRSAAGFQAVMIPSRSLPTIASSDERTIAASRSDASSACLRSVVSSSRAENPSRVGKTRVLNHRPYGR